MILALLLLWSGVAVASADHTGGLGAVYGDETLAPISESKARPIPGDQGVPPLAEGSQIDDLVSQAQKAWEEERQAAIENALPKELPKEVKGEVEATERPKVEIGPPKIHKVMVAPTRGTNALPRPERSGQNITVFSGNLKAAAEEEITLPSGAHAFGRIKFGEEVTAGGDSEVMAELDYAFLGPNNSVVEMNGCIVWLKVKANFHTQRVNGKMANMTCTTAKGRVFTVPMEGPLVAVATGYAGADSDIVMRGPAKAEALKFLGEIAAAYGAATSAAETTASMVAGEHTVEKANNVTGDKARYTQGKVLEAHGQFLKYVSSFFESMQPTLALAPGTKVHLVNRYNVKIPKIFFSVKGNWR